MPLVSRTEQNKFFPPWITAVVCLFGLTALVASSLDLGAYGLARHLSSDFLTPFFFCSDLLTGRYPLSGWTLSASPYFVPDHLVLSTLLDAFGQSGLAYALYTPVFYLALFVLAGGCLHTVTGQARPALIAGLIFGVTLLSLRALPGQAMCLWWIGAPTCHGGVLLLGFAYLWILGAGLRRGEIGRLPIGLSSVGFIGLLSDLLFLFQIILPASFALFLLLRRRHPVFARWLRWQGGCGAGALACAQLFKPICKANDWFYFSRIIRKAPTPANQWQAFKQLMSDVPLLLRDNWMFAVLALAAMVVLFRGWYVRRNINPPDTSKGNPSDALLDFYRVFCVASLFIMLPLPVLTCGWKSANNIRYLFNWLILPGFLLAVEATAKWTAIALAPPRENVRRWSLVGAAMIFAVCLGCALGDLRNETLRFPYPDDVAALDAILQRHGLKYGLAQYWEAKRTTALSHAGAELRQIRANGELYFWDNNAFAYYQRQADGTFSWPAYQYIVTDLLDESAVARVFGDPQSKAAIGRYQVWIYGEEGQRHIREVLESAVQAKLGPRAAKAGVQIR